MDSLKTGHPRSPHGWAGEFNIIFHTKVENCGRTFRRLNPLFDHFVYYFQHDTMTITDEDLVITGRGRHLSKYLTRTKKYGIIPNNITYSHIRRLSDD